MRTKKATKNFLVSLIRNFVGLVLGMVATPIILSKLGEEKFGTLRVMLDWLAHLSLMEFGLYAAVMSLMVKVLGENKSHVGSALKVSFLKYKNVLFLQVISLAVFCLFFEKLVPVDEDLQMEVWISFFILSSSVFFIFSQIFKAHLEASQRGYIVSYVMIFQNIFYIIASLWFLHLGHGLIGQAWAYVASIAFAFVIYAWLCRDEIKIIRFSKDKYTEEPTFKNQRKNLFMTELFVRASLMSDSLIISFLIGTKEVTGFFLTQRLIQVVGQQLQNVSNSSWPALGELYYHKKLDVFNNRVLQLTEVVAFLSGVGLSVLVIFNRAFIVLWTGESTYAGAWITNLAALNAGFFALTSLWSWCFSATHKADLITKIFFVHAIVNVSLSFILTSLLGVVGPLLATAIAYMTVAIWWESKVLTTVFGISRWKLHRSWTLPFLIPIGASIIYVSAYDYPAVHSWLGFFIGTTSFALVLFIFGYFLLVSRSSRDFFKDKFKWRKS